MKSTQAPTFIYSIFDIIIFTFSNWLRPCLTCELLNAGAYHRISYITVTQQLCYIKERVTNWQIQEMKHPVYFHIPASLYQIHLYITYENFTQTLRILLNIPALKFKCHHSNFFTEYWCWEELEGLFRVIQKINGKVGNRLCVL